MTRPTGHANGIMVVELDASTSAAYKPTSLDFINLPNPVEPNQSHPGSQKHPLNGAPRIENARPASTANQDLFSLILDSPTESPAKRQKITDVNVLDLPRLPVRNATKRLRIPPTLSGLHQPPPNAGLLPSINVDQPQIPRLRQQEIPASDGPAKSKYDGKDDTLSIPKKVPRSKANTTEATAKRMKRNKWTDPETECLLKGVSQFGIGNWTKILRCPDYSFQNRTAIDLKDRFRVCCPSEYRKDNPAKTDEPVTSGQRTRASENRKATTKGPPSEQISTLKLEELGIKEPFAKTGRRSRHAYTEEEDEALFKGYKKYGNSWAKIRKDPSLSLSKRKATDLRDRFRTRFPYEYAKLNVGAKSDQNPDKSRAQRESAGPPTAAEADCELDAPKPLASDAALDALEDSDKHDSKGKPQMSKKTDQPSLFSLDDLYLGIPYDNEVDEVEPIVLDRGILDWATGDGGKNTVQDQTKSHGIDPLMTLKLPKPVPMMSTHAQSTPLGAPPPNAAPALPSLANLLPEIATPEQLELPSLMPWFNENDARNSGTTIPPFEELFS